LAGGLRPPFDGALPVAARGGEAVDAAGIPVRLMLRY
jgi:hypothetical protein